MRSRVNLYRIVHGETQSRLRDVPGSSFIAEETLRYHTKRSRIPYCPPTESRLSDIRALHEIRASHKSALSTRGVSLGRHAIHGIFDLPNHWIILGLPPYAVKATENLDSRVIPPAFQHHVGPLQWDKVKFEASARISTIRQY